ncbi:MAG TPA: amino acid ABC transporter substrate-binding protein, partial [Chitinophagaceae bacterium]|nr:amino acid ABC transporter substrate-binding protein [Chitinophagaceae bacterium]
IAGSLDENFGKKLAQKLATLKKQKYVASVMGMPTWDGISDFKKPEYKGIDIIYSTPFYNPRTDKLSHQIIEHFNKVMYARPSDMVMRGYETMWKFGKLLLKYKADIASNISYQDFDVFREYDIQPVLDRETMMLDYFENKKLYFLKWQDGILKGVY